MGPHVPVDNDEVRLEAMAAFAGVSVAEVRRARDGEPWTVHPTATQFPTVPAIDSHYLYRG